MKKIESNIFIEDLLTPNRSIVFQINSIKKTYFCVLIAMIIFSIRADSKLDSVDINLLKNGNFEFGIKGWHYQGGKEPGKYEILKSKQCLYLHSEGSGYHGGVFQSLKLRGNRRYKLSAWIKAEIKRGKVTCLYYDGYLPSSKTGAHKKIWWGGRASSSIESFDWRYVEKIIDTPEHIENFTVSVYPVLFLGNDKVWVKNVQLVDLGPAKPSLFVPSIAPPPELDGQIKDDEWSYSAKSGKFSILGGENRIGKEQTQVFIMRDNKNLYVAFRCNESQIHKIKTTKRERNSCVWEDDEIEFFISTSEKLSDYRQFIVNPLGACWDNFNGEENSWKAKTYVGDDFWSLEMVIPFSYLGIKPEEGMIFRGHFCRAEKPSREISSWPAISSNRFADLKDSARFIFGSYKAVALREIAALIAETKKMETSKTLANEKSNILNQTRVLRDAIKHEADFTLVKLYKYRQQIARLKEQEIALEVKTVSENMSSVKINGTLSLTPELSKNDYKLPALWSIKNIMGKDFWFDIKHMPDLWEKANLQDEDFIKDSIARFYANDKVFKEMLTGQYKIDRPFIIGGHDNSGSLNISPSICRKFLRRYKDHFVCFSADECFGHHPNKCREIIGLPPIRNRVELFSLFMACYMNTTTWRTFRSWSLTYPEFRSHTSCGTATYLDHWILELGAPFSGQEIGATGYSEHLGLCFAFSRGAARQYEKPWRTYLAVWSPGVCGDSEKNYSGFLSPEARRYYRTKDPSQSFDRGPHSGSSISLQRRQLYAAYMAGTNIIRDESDHRKLYVANYNWRHIDKVDPFVKVTRDIPYHLSQAGEIRKELYDNIVKKHDRGIPYTPIALIFDRYHGYIPTYSNKLLGILPFKEADYMMRAIESTLFPLASPRNIQSRATSPYGDIFDVLTNNARLETLNAYRILLLVGDVSMDRLFAQRLIKYVKNGGTLIINAKQLKDFAFPEVFLGCKISKERNESRLGYSLLDGSVISEKKTFDYQKLEMGTAQPLVLSADIGKKENVLVASNKYGKGRVLVTAPDYMMLNNTQMLNIFTHLMARARDELLPIEWNGKVEVLLNRNAEGWVVTLINNEGVTKKGGQKQLVDSSKSVEVRLLLKKEAGGLKIKKIAEWVEGGEFEILKTSKGTQVKLVVPSGDVRILEFKIEK